ncbi:fimbrillin family protein [Bacteroides gallinarum]|uniref:fimbrillin family protein n=1 Tax=Bacteroides gallinarum TaxID=376806 RepID=UPI000376A610|nr:fimbrillin family protein [Bacteroides gallinarum]
MKKIFLAVGVLLFFAACTNDAMNDPLADGPVAMTFTAGIDAVATRVNSEGKAFTEDDKVGIVPMKDGDVETGQFNVLYTYSSDNQFTANPPYWFQDRETVTFNAYYPYDAELSTNGVITIDTKAKNQTAGEETVASDWRKNDYLFASNTADVSSPTVNFTGMDHTFKHVMSKFTLTLKAGDGISDLQALTGYTLGNFITTGTFDIKTGNAVPDAEATTEAISMSVTGENAETLECEPLILLPQDIDSGKLSLTVHYNNQDYHAELKLPEYTVKKLLAGYHYRYTVKVSNTALEITNASIVDWTEADNFDGEATLQ